MAMKAKYKIATSLVISLITTLSVFGESNNMTPCIIYAEGASRIALPGISCSIVGVSYAEGKNPELYLMGDKWYGKHCYKYTLLSRNKEGSPVFTKKAVFDLPDKAYDGSPVFQKISGKKYLFWKGDNKLFFAEFDDVNNSFGKADSLSLPETDYPMTAFSIRQTDANQIIVAALFAVENGGRTGNWRSADYRPYDATGRYTGAFAYHSVYTFRYDNLYSGRPSDPVRMTDMRLLQASSSICNIDYSHNEDGFIIGSKFGGVYYLDGNNPQVNGFKHLFNENQAVIRHPIIGCFPFIFPDEKGDYVDIIASGEGGIFYYSYTGKKTENGNPIYSDPVPVLQQNAPLHCGSLITPNAVDWDKDGATDIVVGNSAGNVMFIKNAGTDRNPEFLSAEEVCAEGEPIHIQPGYGEDVQGPGESRWGYVGLYVYDWDSDGILDLLINDSRGKHTFWKGDGKGGVLREQTIFVNDLELHGTWRCRPGVGMFGGKLSYVTLDDDDDVHLYIREDNRNLFDVSKLYMTDGRVINANSLEAGGKGRLRFELTDFDGDGIKDMLLSTNENHQVPDPVTGLPWSRPKNERGATLLFMRNAGTETAPVFEYPAQLKYNGEYIRLGHHACGSSPCFIGPVSKSGLPNIIAGDEKGALYLILRDNITW